MSVLNVDNLQNSTADGLPKLYGDKIPATTSDKNQCTAWVNFDGADGSIKDSFNVSSVTRNDVGDYTIEFSVEMSNNNYTVSGICANDNNFLSIGDMGEADEQTTSQFTIFTNNYDGAKEDQSLVNAQVFGGK